MIFRLNKAHLFLLICLSLLLILIHARPCVPKQNVVDEETARNKATSANAFAQPPSTLASQKHKNRKRNIPALIFTLLIGVLGGNSLGFVTLLIGVLGGNLLGFVEGAVVFGRGGRKPSGPTIFSPLIKKEDLAFLAIEGSVASLEVIGRGGCGEVLKAELRGSSKKIVAIKKIVQPSMHATELTGDESKNLNRKMCQIRSEINIVGKIRHRNLIPLLAHMSHGDCHYLVYEFMKNGSLQDVLDEVSNGTKELDCLARYKIALGVATGLEHMHFLHNPCIVHRDLKPANVLLDDDMEARISDFGLAKVMPDANIYITGSNVAGTVGYIAPEYLQTQKFTAKSDIYSFGVLLGVLVIGKKPTDLFFHNTDEICLAKWLWNVMASDNLEQAIDSKLMGNGFEHEMLSVLKIACFCTVDDPSDRPSSKDVRCMLSQIKDEIHESRPSTQSSLELSKTILREGKGKLVGNGNSIIKDEIHESRPSTQSSLELSKTISREGKGKLVGNGNSICIREENLWLPDKSEWKDLISQEEEHRWVQSKKSSRNGVLSKKLVYKSAAYAGPHIIIPEIHSNIWKTNLLERLKMLLWHTASDDLPTRERHSKFMTIDNTSCLLCNIGAIESSFHLVFHCHLTRFLWFGSKWNIRLQGFQIDSLENWLKFILDPPIFSPMEADQKVEFLLFGALVLDMVWRARNSILDEAKVISYKDVLLKVFQEHRNLMISGLASIKITN